MKGDTTDKDVLAAESTVGESKEAGAEPGMWRRYAGEVEQARAVEKEAGKKQVLLEKVDPLYVLYQAYRGRGLAHNEAIDLLRLQTTERLEQIERLRH